MNLVFVNFENDRNLFYKLDFSNKLKKKKTFGIYKHAYAIKLKNRKANITFYVFQDLLCSAYKLKKLMVQINATVFQEIYFFDTSVLCLRNLEDIKNM